MTAAEQSSEPRRDYASPATWGDVESVRHEVADLRADVARLESGLHSEVSRVEKSLDARITQVESSLNARITQVESSLNARITQVESGLRSEIVQAESRQDRKLDAGLNELRVEMARMETRLIRWTVAAVVASTASIGALIGILEALR